MNTTTREQQENDFVKDSLFPWCLDRHKQKRYTLHVAVNLVCTGSDIYDQNHRDQCRSNVVSDYTFLSLSADSLDYLRDFYTKNEYARAFATTVWHFIYDNQLDKVALTLNKTGL